LNAVEIEEAISALAEQPFDAQEFPFAFLQAFGNKETTIKYRGLIRWWDGNAGFRAFVPSFIQQ